MNHQPPDRLLRSFERYLRATNRSERTVGNYLENLHQVEAFLRPRGVRLRDATRADLEDFLADLLARRSAATAATRYKVLRVLYRWLEEEEDAPNPMAKMRPPIQPEQPVPRRQVVRCAALRDRPARSLEHRMTVRALRSTARCWPSRRPGCGPSWSGWWPRWRRGCWSCRGSGRSVPPRWLIPRGVWRAEGAHDRRANPTSSLEARWTPTWTPSPPHCTSRSTSC